MKNIKLMRLLILPASFFIAIFLLAPSAKAVTISQLLPEFTARPGEKIEQMVQLYDDSKQGVTVYPIVYNFTEDSTREGTIHILTDPADLKPDREWLKFDIEKLELPADGTLADFPYRIEIPEDGEPGTHLISLVFQTRPVEAEGKDGSAVYIGTNVATNIFLKVLGATVDKIDIDFQVGTYNNSDPNLSPRERKEHFLSKSFFLKPPADFLLTVKNEGNTHQKPDGNIRVVNDFFNKTPEKLLVNPENLIVLPGTNRTFKVPSFGQGLMIGKYRAKAMMLYGSPLRPVEKQVSFWIIPLIEILIILGSLLLLIIIILIIKRIMKKRRKRKEIEREIQLRQKITQELNGKAGKKSSPEQKDKSYGSRRESQKINPTEKKNKKQKKK